MKKQYLWMLAMALCFFFSLPQGSFAYTTENPFTIEKIDDERYAVTGDAETHVLYSMENLDLPVEKTPSLRALSPFSKSDRETIEQVVTYYNKCHLSSILSGVYTLCPRNYFTTEGIFQEANAATIYTMYNFPNLGENITAMDIALQLKDIEIDGDYAKVMVQRDIKLEKPYYRDTKVRSFGGPEAYLLKKIEGQWQIENILFVTDFFTDTYRSFEASHGAKSWQEKYIFSVCPRKSYESDKNFTDFLTKDATYPDIDFNIFKVEDDYADFAMASTNQTEEPPVVLRLNCTQNLGQDK